MSIPSNHIRQTVFITGGSTGIGAAAVELFLKSDCNVAFFDCNIEAANSLVDRLVKEDITVGDRLMFFNGDVRNNDIITDAVNSTVKRWRFLNILIVNAGIHRHNTILDVTDRDIDDVIGVNLLGAVYTLRAASRYIIDAPGNRAIVITASDQALVGKPNAFTYGLTKGALGQMTKSLAIDLAKYGVRVNAVCPATIVTPMVENIFERIADNGDITVEQLWMDEAKEHPLGKCGTPLQVAELIKFLAMENTGGFCTGALYPIDGGLTAM